jgi:YaiO family outer membrane protein
MPRIPQQPATVGNSAYQSRGWPAPATVQTTATPARQRQIASPAKPGSSRRSPWAPLYPNQPANTPGSLPASPTYQNAGPPQPYIPPIKDSPGLTAGRGLIAAALAQNRAQQSADPKNVGLKIKEARYLSWLSRHYTAANRYRAILREHPNHVDALTGYGTALFWQSNWRESENALARAISLAKPDDLAPRNTYFRVLAEQGRASEAYRHAMDLDRQTDHQDAQLGMVIADMLGHIGLHNDGLGYASRPTQDQDLLIRQTEYQAKLAVNQNGKQSARQLASNLVGRHQGLYNAYIAAGDLLGDNGHLNEAASYYRQASEMSPEREEANLGRARISRTRGRHAEALQLFQAAVQANPESVNGWIGVAEMARFQGDYPRAWQALDTAHSVAPGSANVYRAKLKLALAQNDSKRFDSILNHYRTAQPTDPYTTLWQNQWAAHHGGKVSEDDLRGILDPMAPELNAEALGLIQGRPSQITAAVPAAPSPNLDVAARRELKRRIRTRAPGSVNLTAGYEYSSLKPTTILGGTFPDWHEGFFAGFWRQDGGPTLSWDYRHFERFSETAQQLEGGVLVPVGNRWLVGGKGGAALFGNFIPHWRAGAEAQFMANDRWNFRMEYRYLRFSDNPVHQLIPEITWNWHPKFSSTGRIYVTHSRPKGAAKDTGFSGYFDLAYKVASNSHAKIHYAVGDENASTLIRNLIGEKNFQSSGLELRLGINDRWAVIPGYRFERHNLFDLHAVSLALNGRF